MYISVIKSFIHSQVVVCFVKSWNRHELFKKLVQKSLPKRYESVTSLRRSITTSHGSAAKASQWSVTSVVKIAKSMIVVLGSGARMIPIYSVI